MKHLAQDQHEGSVLKVYYRNTPDKMLGLKIVKVCQQHQQQAVPEHHEEEREDAEPFFTALWRQK